MIRGKDDKSSDDLVFFCLGIKIETYLRSLGLLVHARIVFAESRPELEVVTYLDENRSCNESYKNSFFSVGLLQSSSEVKL